MMTQMRSYQRIAERKRRKKYKALRPPPISWEIVIKQIEQFSGKSAGAMAAAMAAAAD